MSEKLKSDDEFVVEQFWDCVIQPIHIDIKKSI